MADDWTAEQSVEVLREMLSREVRKREAAEQRATRLTALAQAARAVEPFVDYAYDEVPTSAGRQAIDAFHEAVDALDAPPAEGAHG